MHTASHHPNSCGHNPPLAPARHLSPAEPQSAALHVQIGRSVDSQAKRMSQVRAAMQSVAERDLVQAIDRWLDGEPWPGRQWTFGHLRVRLEEQGGALTVDGVTIVSRAPIRLHELAPGTRTGVRLEARALAAVAVRGDAGWYDGEPRKDREGVSLVWDGRQYVHGPAVAVDRETPILHVQIGPSVDS